MTNDDGHEPRRPREVGPEPLWNESMYVFWRDESARVSGWTRIAQQPNAGATSTFACVALHDDGGRFRMLDLGDYRDGYRDHGRWSGLGQQWWWEDDVLRISHQSDDCSYDLSWSGFYEPVDFHALMATFVEDLGEINAHHVEQSGSVSGRVHIGDREIDIDALGHRDHSWGHRDTGSMLTSRWMIGTVGPDLSWSGVTVLKSDGALIRTGFVVRGGEVTPMTGVEVNLDTKEDGLSYVRGEATFGLVDGSSLAVTLTDVTPGGILEVPPWLGLEASAVATIEGRHGVGNCEVSNNITGGSTAPPVLVTGGATTNGLAGFE
ncbi:MAG TPA: hypothetical protein VGA13_13395 [Acidimicrobiales bacterium]